jgi:hypothetical protein
MYMLQAIAEIVHFPHVWEQAALIFGGFAIHGFDYSWFIFCSQNLLFTVFPKLFAVSPLKYLQKFENYEKLSRKVD